MSAENQELIRIIGKMLYCRAMYTKYHIPGYLTLAEKYRLQAESKMQEIEQYRGHLKVA